MAINATLLEEAKRIKQIAISHYSPGTYIRATFKNGQQKEDIFYYNPRDIPEKINSRGSYLYLYSVWEAKET